MKQFQLTEHGKAFRIDSFDVDEPTPGPNDVLIKMEAWSLNFRDLLMLDAKSSAARAGLIPVSDGVGIVKRVGSDVTRFKPGDRVANIFFRDWVDGPFEPSYVRSAFGGDVPGVLSEFVALPEHALAKVPESLDPVDAATLPCAAVTTWQALFVRSKIDSTSTVLLQGTGGVSIFGLQFATALGAKTIITSSSDDKLKKASLLGATHTINYTHNPDWDDEVLRITEGRGVSHVLEVGGTDTFPRSLKSLSGSGTIAQIGVLTGFGPNTNLMRLQSINSTIVGISVGSRAHLEETIEFVTSRKIRPVIDRTFKFDDAPAAFDYLRSGAHFGKIVIEA